MSSKKKKRHEEFLKRKAKRVRKTEQLLIRRKIIEEGNIEDLAKIMGIKLE